MADVEPGIRTVLTAGPAEESTPLAIRSLEEAFAVITGRRRAMASLMLALGIAVVLIGSAGVYAVMASLVAHRRHEIAVRMVLGASPARLATDVIGHASAYVCAGLVVGLPFGLVVCRLFESLVFGVSALDPSVYAAVSAVLVASGMLAAALPALKASRVDPMQMMRTI